METPIRIAIGHKSRMGKDTTAVLISRLLEENWKGHSLVTSFAAELYKVTESIQKSLGKKVEKDRSLLREVGEGLKRVYGPNVWVDVVEKSIEDTPDRPFIVTDMRLPQEVEMLKRHKFVTLNIKGDYRETVSNPEHITETALDNFKYDYVIENTGSIDELKEKVEEFYKFIVSQKRI